MPHCLNIPGSCFNSVDCRVFGVCQPGAPPRTAAHIAAAYDTRRGVTVLFHYPSGQTWEFDGATWTQRFPSNHPPPLADHRMAYDSRRAVVVLFSKIGGLWEYDGDDWVQRTSLIPPSPSPRSDFGPDFDSARGVTVLHPGNPVSPLTDTWEWDGVNWTQRLPGDPGGAIIARARHVLVFDSARKTSLVLGGSSRTGARAKRL